MITKILIANNGIAAVGFDCYFAIIGEMLQSAGKMHPRHKAMELRELPVGASCEGKNFHLKFSVERLPLPSLW